MSVLTRTNYIPNTLIESAKVNIDFNQLVDILSGVSTTKDALIKFSHATDPVLRVDQLGAGEILRILQNGAVKSAFDNSGHLYIGEGVTDATPANGLVSGTGGSGTNIAGGNLDVTGGRGTGNAEPGFFAVRYPLRGASGTTLQSLSADRFPVTTALYTNTSVGTTITNTTSETSLFNGVTASAGSTRTLEAGFTKAGTLYCIRIEGDFVTTGTPTMQFRLKLGSTTINDTTALTMPTVNGRFELVYYLNVTSIGASATNRCHLRGQITSAANGLVTVTDIMRVDANSVDLTASQTFDATAQWGTAAAGNQILLTIVSIERIR